MLAVAATILLAALALYIKERLACRRLQRRLTTAEGELAALKSRPEKHEYRVERFELLWYPSVTADGQDKAILSAAPGLPHCRACLLPLALERQEWHCRQCGAKHPESLADVVVTDSITQLALKYFQERHPGYRIPKA